MQFTKFLFTIVANDRCAQLIRRLPFSFRPRSTNSFTHSARFLGEPSLSIINAYSLIPGRGAPASRRKRWSFCAWSSFTISLAIGIPEERENPAPTRNVTKCFRPSFCSFWIYSPRAHGLKEEHSPDIEVSFGIWNRYFSGSLAEYFRRLILSSDFCGRRSPSPNPFPYEPTLDPSPAPGFYTVSV